MLQAYVRMCRAIVAPCACICAHALIVIDLLISTLLCISMVDSRARVI